MTALTWDSVGERYYEVGVDQGVFYGSDGIGVAWNGLTSVSETRSGGSPTPYYMDGIKYANISAPKELEGTIEAFTYPEKFAEYDGWLDIGSGLSADQQASKPFGLSYRTLIGNDVEGTDYNYKIHLLYNVLAEPSEAEYESLNDDTEPSIFSWNFTTTPIRTSYKGVLLKPISHLIIDPKKSNPTQMRFIEEYLYGSASREPMLPPLTQLLTLFEFPMVTLNIEADEATGLSNLIESKTLKGDLRGRLIEGRYVAGDFTRLSETTSTGLYKLENNG